MRIVIAGATEAGIELARILSLEGNEVVLIDRDNNLLQEAEEHLDVMTVHGDPTRRAVLRKAQIANAHGFVALSDRDNDNVLAASLAKTVGAKIAVARMDDPDFYLESGSHELNLLNVDLVLCATRLATIKLIDSIIATHLPFLGIFANASIRVALVTVGEHSDVIGKSAAEITFQNKVHTVAVVSSGYLRLAERVSSVESGDRLLVVGAASDMLYLWRESLPKHTNDRALIVGGGDVGTNLARILSEHVPRVDVVEKNPLQAERVAASSDRITVFSGDARSAAFLQDQQIDTVSYLVAATGEDEVNLLVSLLGRKLGVAHPIVLLHRPGYAELYTELGIQGTVGLHEVVADHAKYAIAPCGLVHYNSIPETGHVVSEWRLPVHSEAIGTQGMSLSDIPLPEDARLIGIARGTKAIRMSSSVRLEGGETLILLGPEESQARSARALRKLLQEKTK